jgi:SlyX protein
MSNTVMEPLQRIDQRLTDLEIKSSFGEDLLDTLNRTVFRQQEQIDLLTRELRALHAQVLDGGNRRGPHDDLPPHY